MSNVQIGDMWTTTTGPAHPAEIVVAIEGDHARFASGGFWPVDRLTAALGWKRIRPAREAAYEARITELKDMLNSVTRSGVENAARYAADLDGERKAGAAAVERIRVALLEGATDEVRQWATAEALEEVSRPAHVGHFCKMARAYLALSASHAEARTLLDDIGTRALKLLGKGGT